MSIVLEILLTIVIIVALLLLVGVPLESIIMLTVMILLGLVALSVIVFIVFFVFTDVSLLFRKKVKGKFLFVNEEGRYDRAVYDVNGQKYTCLFPAETFGRERIYKKDAEYTLLIPRTEKKLSAYDRHSLFIIVIGSLFSLLFIFVLKYALQFLLANM